MKNEIELYGKLLDEIKVRLRNAQHKAAISVNAELINLYWDIGKMIYLQQQDHGWGAGITRKLALDLKNELPEEKGFSERNLKFMVQFFKEYSEANSIGKQPVSQLEQVGKQLVSQIPWGHNILLMQKIKSKEVRYRYLQQAIESGWSRDVLAKMIKSDWHKRQGFTISNFKSTLPNLQSTLAQQMLKDPYIFDFLTDTSSAFATRMQSFLKWVCKIIFPSALQTRTSFR
ncbi:MAG: DUF1016 N-terminal domain-containing protein [Bacteroidales bacterium]|nr:DUF1016 N-terminal domain-containing protein [Bacteroidales bacterium]